MKEWLLEVIRELKRSSQSNADESAKRLASMIIILLCFHHLITQKCIEMSDLCPEDAKILFSLLCLYSDMQEKKCFDYDCISTLVQQKTKLTLSDAIISFCKHFCTIPSMWPQWLCAVPLLNFLKGHSQPFGQLQLDAEKIQWDNESLSDHHLRPQSYTEDMRYACTYKTMPCT